MAIENYQPVDIAIAEQERLRLCKKEMDAVFKKYGCALDVGLIIRPGKIEPLVRVVLDPRVVMVPDGNGSKI